jgi:YggT family protein
MFIISNLLQAIAFILDTALTIYMWIIIISSLLTWVNPDPYNQIVRFLYSVTDPVLRPIRKRLGMTMGIDISPLIVIFAIMFARSFIVKTLFDLASKMN